jgi:hypothetical protein
VNLSKLYEKHFYYDIYISEASLFVGSAVLAHEVEFTTLPQPIQTTVIKLALMGLTCGHEIFK